MLRQEVQLRNIHQFIIRMPSLTTTVMKVFEVCNSPSVSPYDLNRVISLDPVLTGKVLRLINSAYYGLPQRIASLTRAIIMLGINTVKNLVLATSVLAGCKRLGTIKAIPVDDFWAHSLGSGVISKTVARIQRVPTENQEMYFVAGLMHDLGKLPMMACYPELYDQALGHAAGSQLLLFQAEQVRFGFDHCQIGSLIAARWKLDETMKHAMVNHHQAAEGIRAPQSLLDNVRLANLMACHFKIGAAGEGTVDMLLLHSLAERCGVTLKALVSVRPQIEQEIQNAKVFLQTA